MIFAFNCLIFLCIFKSCVKPSLCSLSNEITLDELKSEQNDLVVDSEEIHRRRKSVEAYFSDLSDVQKEWIETYHLNFQPRSNIAHQTNKHSISRYQYRLEDDASAHKMLKSPVHYTSEEKKNHHSTDDENGKKISETITKQSFYSFDSELFKPTKTIAEYHYLSSDHSYTDNTNKKLDSLLSDNGKKSTGSKSILRSTSDEVCVREKIKFYLMKTCDVKNYMQTSHFKSHFRQGKNYFVHAESRKGEMPKIEDTSDLEKNASKSKTSPLSKSPEIKETSTSKDTKYNEQGLTTEWHRVDNHRQNVVNSYVSNLIQTQENWIETYHFSSPKDDSGQKERYVSYEISKNINFINSQDSNSILKIDNYAKENSKPPYFKEKKYFLRWTKMLLHKLSDYSLNDQSSLSFSFSVDSINTLKELSSSKKFDIVTLDDFISDFISNATLHNAYSKNFYADSMPEGITLLYVVVVFFSVYILMRYPYLGFVYVTSLILIVWNGYKMYKQKLSDKHAFTSRINPAYCESVLNQESGIFAHLKEYFRYFYHNKDCKEYYAALLVDPLSEISLPVIVSDLVANIISQISQACGHSLNQFFKNFISGIGILDMFPLFLFLIIVLSFGLLIFLSCLGYKLNLPFFMGSIEPTTPLFGSRVEDVKFNERKHVLQSSCNIPVPPQLNITNVIHLPDIKDKCKFFIESSSNCEHPKKYVLPKASQREIRRLSL